MARKRKSDTLSALASAEEANVSVFDRVNELELALAEGDAGSDPMWFAMRLNAMQIRYAATLMANGGDWKDAAKRAGYSASTARETIEGSDVMQAYLRSLEAVVVVGALVDKNLLVSRLDRIARKTEENGQYKEAIAANKVLGEFTGAFKDQGGQTTDKDGNAIMIAPNQEDDWIDAEATEIGDILALNGINPSEFQKEEA